MSEVEPTRVAWLRNREFGTTLGIRFVVGLCDVFGRGVARAFVRVLMLYYYVAASRARAASRLWLERVFGRPPTRREVYRHLLTFAFVALDRVFMLRRRYDLFEIRSHGTEHLRALADARRGAILVGGHVGSFEAMRLQAGARDYDVRILTYVDNARKINAVFSAIDPSMSERVITLGSSDAIFRARDAIESGAMVAVLADRTGLNEKTVLVPFCGEPAPIASGPFLLAAALRCPVLLVFGIYRGENRYDVYCEPIADASDFAGGRRSEVVESLATRYAARLEHYAREAPFNWFNLYDFWHPQG